MNDPATNGGTMEGERFTVVRHHDERGTWYRVIDGMNENRTIKAFRGREVAHRFAAEANSGWRRVHRSGRKSDGRTVSA
jgi:hypothetical protein